MLTIINALLPVFGLILMGYMFRRLHFPGDGFWAAAEKLTYYVLFPALLIVKLSATQFQGAQPLLMAAALITVIIVVTTFLLVISRFLPFAKATFSSVYQGSIRFNTFVGFAAVAAFHGDPGLGLAAVAAAAMIPLVNVLCVMVLQYFSNNAQADIKKTLLALAANPLILACAIGIMLNLAGIGLPVVVNSFLDILSNAALPLGLLTVGAGIVLTSLRDGVMPIMLASLIKLIGLPLLALLVCQVLGVDQLETRIAVIFTSLPTAISSYILARQLGGDAGVMASIITVQTLLAAITMPIILFIV